MHQRLCWCCSFRAVFGHSHHFLHSSVALTTTHTVTLFAYTFESFRFFLVLWLVWRLAFRKATAGAALHVTHVGARACRGLLGRRESARSVDRSKRVGVGADSQNECGLRVHGVAAPPTRPGIFDVLQNRTDRRLRGCRPRRIAPESRTAVRSRWRHRLPLPPAHRKVKARSLFPLMVTLLARRESFYSDDARQLCKAPKHHHLCCEHCTHRESL